MDDQGFIHHQERIERRFIKQLVEQVLLAEHADDLVDASTTDKDLLVVALAYGFEYLIALIVSIDPLNFEPGVHDVAYASVADREDTLHDRLLRLLYEAPFPAGRNEHFDLFGCMECLFARAWPQPCEPQDA